MGITRVTPPDWVFHNTDAADDILRDGMSCGSFSAKPIDFGRSQWVAIRKEDIGQFDSHEYGGTVALEPHWTHWFNGETWEKQTEDGRFPKYRVIPPQLIVRCDNKGKIVAGTGHIVSEQDKEFFHQLAIGDECRALALQDSAGRDAGFAFERAQIDTDLPRESDGQCGRGVYAYLAGDIPMRDYYTAQGEKTVYLRPKLPMFDLTRESGAKMFCDFCAKKEKPVRHDDPWLLGEFLYPLRRAYSGVIVRHAGTGIPTSRQAIFFDSSAFDFEPRTLATPPVGFAERFSHGELVCGGAKGNAFSKRLSQAMNNRNAF